MVHSISSVKRADNHFGFTLTYTTLQLSRSLGQEFPKAFPGIICRAVTPSHTLASPIA